MLKKMKFIIIAFILLIAFSNVNYAADVTLERIVSTFNNCSTVKEYAKLDVIWSATSADNSINIEYKYFDQMNYNFKYTLDGNILSTNIANDEKKISAIFTLEILIDSIGELHGYSEGELHSIFESGEIENYTLEKEGLKTKVENDGSMSVKIDITKKIPLVDFTNTFIEVEDLEYLKNTISGDGSAEKKKGNIWFNKSGYDGDNVLLIAEKSKLSDNSYKSLLSLLEVMFNDNKVIDYFKKNYPSITNGNKEFEGFKIEINPSKDEWEEHLIPSDGGYEFMRVTIDKNLVLSAIKNTTNESKSQIANKTADLDKLPRTGEETKYTLIALYGIIVICTLALIATYVYSKKKSNK